MSPSRGGASLRDRATERAISRRASRSTCSSFEFFHGTRRSMMPNSRFRSASCAASSGNSSGTEDGSSTNCANNTALHAASGRRAHQRCRVEGCPWRIDFSFEDASLIAANGNATSMSFLR